VIPLRAVIVVDMINDFVTGRFGSRRAERIVPDVATLLGRARNAGVPVIYVRDAHHPDDPELRVWGKHAMAGTHGSAIVKELQPERGEKVFGKRQYSGFFNSSLDGTLRGRNVDEILFAGISTDICVQHNVADAFFRGYRTAVVSDCVESINPQRKKAALKYMKEMYGSSIIGLRKVKF
jgi:nicotinamidase-related amidase